VSKAGGMIIDGFEVVCSIAGREVFTMTTVFGFFPPTAFTNQVGLAIDDHQRSLLTVAGTPVALSPRATGARLAGPMLMMVDRVEFVGGAGTTGLGVVRGTKDVDISEWFFKAHFFQDPVQPGSLGVEALLQLLQVYLLETGHDGDRFEPIMLGTPMTWTYRGQVTPTNTLITTVMEITDTGTDERGAYAIGTGSLWCDGLRIYEVKNMGMRLVPGARPSTSTMSFRADRGSHPHLADHAINGTPVVPVAYALEWFARAAAAHRPDRRLVELTDIRVLKGLVLDGFDDGHGLEAVVTVSDIGADHTVSLELNDSAGRSRYRATGRLGRDQPSPDRSDLCRAPIDGSLRGDVYEGGVLFHGSAFQVISEVATVSVDRLAAWATGVLANNWPTEPWRLDVALLDGALQAALLLTEHALDSPSLPTAIGRLRTFALPAPGTHVLTVTATHVGRHSVVSDVSIWSSAGDLVAELTSVETTVRR
jgi:3-hydroxymyristoyl/3-hydroxydecanoyl-(acyl carrier protein) dehydratase